MSYKVGSLIKLSPKTSCDELIPTNVLYCGRLEEVSPKGDVAKVTISDIVGNSRTVIVGSHCSHVGGNFWQVVQGGETE